MKSQTNRTMGFATCKMAAAAVFLLTIAGFVSVPAFAGDTIWRLESSHSSAHLFLGSPGASDPWELGVAGVNGRVELDAANPAASVFDFAIASGYAPNAVTSSNIAFRSKQAYLRPDGTLAVAGDLVLTRAERSVTLNPGEDYSGPVYGEPVLSSITRAVVFTLPNVSAAAQRDGRMQLSASVTLGREDSGQMFPALAGGDWPTVIVADEQCEMPSTVGEDYAGPSCTATPIAVASDRNCHMPASVGEDYAGVQCAAPEGNQVTIRLDLALTQAGSGLVRTASK